MLSLCCPSMPSRKLNPLLITGEEKFPLQFVGIANVFMTYICINDFRVLLYRVTSKQPCEPPILIIPDIFMKKLRLRAQSCV